MQNKDLEIFAAEEILQKISKRLEEWKKNNAGPRLWKRDPSIWKKRADENIELSNRLGWLDLPVSMQGHINSLVSFAQEIKDDFDDIILLGMGGSSLAPEVFYKTFGNKKEYPQLRILDSTHPLSVRGILDNYNLKRTAFIVASKSGGTTETMSFYYTFYNALSGLVPEPGKHFIAITDSGTSLEKLAIENKFRKIFTTPDDVGGRYSALTYFGLVPAALIGADLTALLKSAEKMEKSCGKDSDIFASDGFRLGAFLGELSLMKKDKITFFISPEISSFPAWIEQLIAESTGKEGKGIVPVAFEPAGRPDLYGTDRGFVYIRLKGGDNNKTDDEISELKNSGFPVVIINIDNVYDLGREIYMWEIATALAGSILEINPFDQPNVQLAKSLANQSMEQYGKTGKLPTEKPAFTEKNISFFGESIILNLKGAINEFLTTLKEGNYLAIMAFVPFSDEVETSIENFKRVIRNKCRVAVTSGYGPRFLHSTGQLHKGDGNKGLFIQITTDPIKDLDVPGKGYSFGTLITAQAQGDLTALRNNGRKVVRLHISGNLKDHIDYLTSLID